MRSNTTNQQDREIKDADQNHINNLIEIIDDLDAQISAWKDAAECDDPDDLVDKLNTLNEKIENLENTNK